MQREDFMFKKVTLSFLTFTTLAMTTACGGNFKTPSLSNPHSMSADTLCYRAAYAKSNEALNNEVAARNLDCENILQSAGAAPGESRY
jgi:hypothetical protein